MTGRPSCFKKSYGWTRQCKVCQWNGSCREAWLRKWPMNKEALEREGL